MVCPYSLRPLTSRISRGTKSNKRPRMSTPEDTNQAGTQQTPEIMQQEPLDDPIASLPAPAIFAFLQNLSAKDLIACCLVSKQWRSYATDDRLWEEHCKTLWEGKVYIPQSFREDSNHLRAYGASIKDARRTFITEEELTSFTWLFQFKAAAGPFWRVLVGDAPLRRWFHPDRTMTGPKEDPLWQISEEQQYTWQFRKSKERRRGRFVQVNRYPSLEPARTADWGWMMQNIWVTFVADLRSDLRNPGKGNEPAHDALPTHAANPDAFVNAVAQAVVAAATAGADNDDPNDFGLIGHLESESEGGEENEGDPSEDDETESSDYDW